MPSDTVTPDSQPVKKKKSSKHNKKKKKKQPQSDLAAEVSEPAETANIAEITEAEKPTLRKAASDSIDTDDPFYDQLKDIEAIKRGDHVMADAKDAQSQPDADIVKSVCLTQLIAVSFD